MLSQNNVFSRLRVDFFWAAYATNMHLFRLSIASGAEYTYNHVKDRKADSTRLYVIVQTRPLCHDAVHCTFRHENSDYVHKSIALYILYYYNSIVCTRFMTNARRCGDMNYCRVLLIFQIVKRNNIPTPLLLFKIPARLHGIITTVFNLYVVVSSSSSSSSPSLTRVDSISRAKRRRVICEQPPLVVFF